MMNASFFLGSDMPSSASNREKLVVLKVSVMDDVEVLMNCIPSFC